MNQEKEEAARHLAAETAQHLMDSGWCQGEAMDEDGRQCLVGAIDNDTVQEFLDLKILIAKRINTQNLISWNDQKGRKAEEVIGMLQDIAEGLV